MSITVRIRHAELRRGRRERRQVEGQGSVRDRRRNGNRLRAAPRRSLSAGGNVAIAGRRVDVLERGSRERWANASTAVQCDISDTESVQRAVATAGERCGPLRLAVNSAYSAMVGSFLETSA